jgi:malonyl CoA-acyl carrier protein transacylase
MKKVVVVFPGQGSQRPGMAKDFYEEYQCAREVFEEASDSIGVNLKQICFEENELLNLTEFTQPAILTTEIAMYRTLEKELGIQSSAFAGHSLGEYSALVASNAILLADAVKIVKKRGQLMQEAVPQGIGAMAACICSDLLKTDFLKLVAENEVEVANFNSFEQIVISGKKENVEKTCKVLSENIAGIQTISLNVSAPFHSSLMKPIEREFQQYLESFKLEKENSKFVLSNYTGDFHIPEELVVNLTKQISGSVNWIKNMEILAEQKLPIIEIGPNRPLSKFFSTMGIEVQSIINTKSIKKLKLN